jgi:hypothetical protein
MRSRQWCAFLVLVFLPGCGSDTAVAPADPAFSHTGIADLSGSAFLGSGRRSLCSIFSPGSPLLIRAFAADLSSFETDFPICPTNSYVIPVVPGSYFVRVSLPLDSSLGQLPQRWMEPVPVTVEFENVVKDLHVGKGTALRGGVTVDGVGESGALMNVLYADVPTAGAAQATSGPAGTWIENGIGRSLVLQTGVRYSFSGCQGTPVAGIGKITISPSGPVLFPSESDRFDCEFTSGDALQYTHRATRLKLTSLPGDIGGVSDPLLFPDIGYGYSAQFPLAAGAAPRAGPALINRQLFRGGLVLGAAPDQMISGTELDGFVICAVSPCRALGFDGQVTVREGSGAAREVTWTYSDDGSLRPRGLGVIQRSFDGRAADYVLYAFRITNRGSSAITFTPGVFLDFDVSPEFFSNTGYTDLSGQLMVTTTTDSVGRHFGSVVIGAPAGGRSYFYTADRTISESEAVAALRGEISNASVVEPSDVRVLQGGATIKLGRGKSTDVWVAIAAGESRAQIISNARAAVADAAVRQRAGNTFAINLAAQTRPRSPGRVEAGSFRSQSGKLCKAGCGGD